MRTTLQNSLTTEDYQNLALKLNNTPEQVRSGLAESHTSLSFWRVDELKEIIRFLKHKVRLSFQGIAPVFQIAGRKADLIKTISSALQFHGVPIMNFAGYPGYNNNNNNNQYNTGYQQPNYLHGHGQQQQHQAPRQPAYQQQQQQQQSAYSAYADPTRGIDVNALVLSEKYTKLNRSPFFSVKHIVGKAPCVAGTKALMQFTLPPEVAQKLRNPKMAENKKFAVHLRLFSSRDFKHFGWNRARFEVHVNHNLVPIQMRVPTKNKIRKKGYKIEKPLDITQWIATENSIQVLAFRDSTISDQPPPTQNQQAPAGPDFQGIVTCELVRERSMNEVVSLAERFSERNQLESGDQLASSSSSSKKSDDDKFDLPKKPRRCEVCGSSKGLLRCSRCKNAWYCGAAHQQQHWPIHQHDCIPPETRRAQEMAKFHKMKQENSSEHVEETIMKVSLKCPLTIMRIRKPARGKACQHPQCFDCEGWISFCHNSGIWQCPVCHQALPLSDLVVDNTFLDILEETSDEIDSVKIFPDGKYQTISLEEELAQEKRKQERLEQRRKKRKLDENLPSSSSTNHANKQHKPSASAASAPPKQGSANAPICLD